MRNHTLLTQKEETDLLKRAKAGDRAAVESLVEHNQALVVWIAERYHLINGYQTLDDLVQWGNMGLMRAVEKWDGREGKFSTYAVYWIKAFIRRNASHGTVFSMSSRDSLFLSRVCRARSWLLANLERDPEPEEIAARAGLPLDVVERALGMLIKEVNLDGDSGPDDDYNTSNPYIEAIESADAPTEYQAEHSVLIEQLSRAVQQLSPVQRTVIIRRYLVEDPDPLRIISRDMHVSKQYINQVEQAALIALREMIGVSMELSR